MVVVDFSSHIWEFWGNIWWINPLLCFFFKWRPAHTHRFLLLKPGSIHSSSEGQDYCGQVFPNELHGSLFPWFVPMLCLVSIVSPLWLDCWVKGVCMFRCNLPPILLAEWVACEFVSLIDCHIMPSQHSQATLTRLLGQECRHVQV